MFIPLGVEEKRKEIACLEALINCAYQDEKGRMDKSELVKWCQFVSVKLLCNNSCFFSPKCRCALRSPVRHNGL